MNPAFREEDAALLGRLEDEIAFEALWRAQAGDARAPHARAAGLVTLLRRLVPAAVDAASRGDAALLASRLVPDSLAGASPELLHHLAIHHGDLARALVVRAPRAALDAETIAIACWLALGEERSYLEGLARAVVAGASSEADLRCAIAAAPLAPIEALGKMGMAGARDATASARHALAALGRIDAAARRAGVTGELRKRALSRAEALRAAAADAAAAPAVTALAEARTRGDLEARAPELFGGLVGVWRWAEEDEAIERIAVEEFVPFGWSIYREGRMRDLGRHLALLEPLIDRMASRIVGDPAQLAYAGHCAQMLVFRAETTTEEARQLALAERALVVCPSHRNGRLILASLLCDRAMTSLREAPWGASGGTLRAATELVDRAESLFPTSRRLPEARAAIEAAKQSGRWPRG